MAEMPTPKKRGPKAANPTPAAAAPSAPVAPTAPAAPQVASPQPAPQVAQPVAPVAASPEPVKEKAVRKNTLPVKEKDANGFAVGSKAGLMYAWLLEGKYTKEQILAGLDQQYPGANNKTTLGVFLSDLQKAVGTYSTSRGCTVNKAENGILSLSFPK